ncbi:MAG: hypothetical protein FWB94_11590 [Chitinispirillia bacterium]|nr:hypothetical protein [Chitinispirillia bacterium]
MMPTGLFAGVRAPIARVACAAAFLTAVWTAAAPAQTIVINNDGEGWDGLTVTLISEDGACGSSRVLHRAVPAGSGRYVFTGVVAGEYVLCVNRDVAVDVSIYDGGASITPDVLDFSSQ